MRARILLALAASVALTYDIGSAAAAPKLGRCTGVSDWHDLARPKLVNELGSAVNSARYDKGAVDIAPDPVTAKRLYAANGSQVARSTDGGCSWKALWSLPPQGQTSTGYSADTVQIDRLVATRGRGFGGLYAITRSPSDAQNRLLRSDDYGEHFQPADSGLPPRRAFVIGKDPRKIYAVVLGNSRALVFRSTDAGLTWSPQGLLSGSADQNYLLRADPNDPDGLWALGPNSATATTLWHSTDGGATFQSKELPVLLTTPSLDVVTTRAGVTALVVASATTVDRSDSGSVPWISEDRGGSWHALPMTPRPLQTSSGSNGAPDSPNAAYWHGTWVVLGAYAGSEVGYALYRLTGGKWVEITPAWERTVGIRQLVGSGLGIVVLRNSTLNTTPAMEAELGRTALFAPRH